MSKRALVVATNHSDFGEGVEPTGLWLSELTHFYDEAEAAGLDIDIVSPLGGKIPIDGRSLRWPMYDASSKRRHEDPNFMAKLEDTASLSDIDWKRYDVVYFAGGHGAMWDFAESEQLHRLVRDMYEGGKVVAAVCHGVAALQNVRLTSGAFLVNGKAGTGFPYRDEAIAGVKKLVPYNLEGVLRDRGMDYSKSFFPLRGHVVADGRLITGQNPNSAKQTAQMVVQAIC